jgi:hypothetical protein
LDKALYFDAMISADEAEYDKLPAEERDAWRSYHKALEATQELFELYKSSPALFRKLAAQMMLLPCFLSRHPDNARFNRFLLEDSTLCHKSTESACQPKPQHLVRQSWPIRYAYAIIETIDLTADTYEDRLPFWAEIYGYGAKHPIPMSQYEEAARKLNWDEERQRLELPSYVGSYKILPVWTELLSALKRPFNSANAQGYWRVGKAMILEEMPDFHERHEWESYRRRRYKTGSKPGAVQHAIFKDILAALRTIAGSNHRRTAAKTVTK